MAINFVPNTLLKASDLNNALNAKADLTTTAPQQFRGQINAPIVEAGVAISTDDLTVTGDAVFSSTNALQLPSGTTLQRPLLNTFGMIRGNTSTGQYELMLGTGNWGQIVTTTAATSPSSPPLNLTGATFGVATDTSIPVTWSAPGGGTAPFLYNLSYRPAGATTWQVWVSGTSATTATVSGLLPATRYEFQVRANNTSGFLDSPVSASATVGYHSGGPANVQVGNPTSTTLQVQWSPVQSSIPVAYQVQYAPIGANVWTNAGPAISGTSLTLTGLQPNQTYDVQVISRTTGGDQQSLAAQGITSSAATVAPNQPTALTVSNVTVSGLSLSWTAPTAGSGPLAYQVQYQPQGSTTWYNYLTPVATTATTVGSLTSSTAYSFRVQAINSAGTAYSQTANVTTGSAAASASGDVAEFQTSGPSVPVLSGPILGTIVTNSALAMNGVSFDNPAAAFTAGSISLSVSCGAGQVTMTDAVGNPISGSGTPSIRYFGTLAMIKQALATLTYTSGSSVNTDTVNISTTDMLAQQASLSITVNTIASGSGTGAGSAPPPNGNPQNGQRTASGQPTDSSGKQALLTRKLLDIVGLNTRFETPSVNGGYSLANAATIENQINFTGAGGGIRLVRQFCAGNINQTWLAQIAQNSGAFSYVLVGDDVTPNLYNSVIQQMINMASAFPNYVAGVAGFDSADLTGDLPLALQNQQTIYADAKQISSNLPVYQVTPYSQMPTAAYLTPADIATANLVAQYSPDSAYNNNAQGAIAQAIAYANTATPNKPVVITNVLYNTFADGAAPIATSGFVAETVHAKYLLEAILSAYQFQVQSLFVALQDDPTNYPSSGLFRPDGTPKPAAWGLRNMFQLFRDQGVTARNFTAGHLNYTVSNTPAQIGNQVNTGYRDALFQRSDGVFFLAMWNEQPLNAISNATLTVPATNVTLTFNETYMTQIDVFDPFNTSTFVPGGAPVPVQSVVNATQMTVSLPAWPIFVRIQHP